MSKLVINGNKLGNVTTIRKDIDKIKTRWLSNDKDWFQRATTARILTKQRLLQQLVDINELISDIKNNKYDTITSNTEKGDTITTLLSDIPKKIIMAESQKTTIITKIYEIDSAFDPESYLNQMITDESENGSVK